ncbi:helix-turn-helix domain-containing protein [Cytobacillus sp. FSL W7-1323]|uniref:helix-turn-helix domain-containing protein n=1 Tax=Cytobacillus sp. FSL W7-1323 TaxID=2921700 RepID=UPI0031586E8E
MNDLTPKILEELRENRGWSKTEVARRLGIKTVSTYANWEYGIRTPDKEMLSKLASLYGTSIDYLITGDKGNKRNGAITKEEKDIAKRLEEFKKDLTEQDGLSFMGEPMSEEAIESLTDAMEHIFRQTQRINKKYIPKKYRDREND